MGLVGTDGVQDGYIVCLAVLNILNPVILFLRSDGELKMTTEPGWEWGRNVVQLKETTSSRNR